MAEEFNYTGRFDGMAQEFPGLKPLLDAIGAFLEDRDRELEAWLADFARNAVSITNITEEVWTPAAHALSHAPGGSDPVDGLPGLIWRGTWSAATEYHLRDAVSRLGTAYYCITGSSLNDPPESSPGDWDVLASKGDTGATGADADPMLAAILATPPRGQKGDTGPTGPDGDPVIAGLFAHGPRGQKGDKGDTGLTGSAGADADEGLVWSHPSP